MPDQAPHLAFPVRVVGGRFASIDQAHPEHIRQCAEVILRTEAGTFDHQPELGLADLVGRTPPLADELLDALERFEPRAGFLAREDLTDIAQRIDRVRVEQQPPEETA